MCLFLLIYNIFLKNSNISPLNISKNLFWLKKKKNSNICLIFKRISRKIIRNSTTKTTTNKKKRIEIYIYIYIFIYNLVYFDLNLIRYSFVIKEKLQQEQKKTYYTILILWQILKFTNFFFKFSNNYSFDDLFSEYSKLFFFFFVVIYIVLRFLEALY